jgi:hypothetical protein
VARLRIASTVALAALGGCSGEVLGLGDARSPDVCATGKARHATIGEAVAAAPEGAELVVCAGIFSENLRIERSLRLRGAGIDATILDAGGRGTALAVAGTEVVVEGFTIRGGDTSDYGGGLRCEAGAIELRDSAVVDNRAFHGGGLWSEGCAVTIRGGEVVRNVAEEGGGLYIRRGQGTIEDLLVAGNQATEDDGGGLRIFESELRIARTAIVDNRAGGDGGGAKISHLPCELVDNEIRGNHAEGAGGGLELDNDSSVVRGGRIAENQAGRGGGVHVQLWPWHGGVVEDVEVRGNRAWRGGGLHVEDSYEPVVVRRLRVEDNLADQGGGLYARGAPLLVANTLVAGNQAYDEGAGLFLRRGEMPTREPGEVAAEPALALAFLVLHGNAGEIGDALWTDARGVSIESSILTGHAGTAVVVAPGATPSWRYNDTYPATFEGMATPTGSDGNLATEPAFTDPDLGDFHLRAASACIDAGNPSFTDPDGSRADMGLHGGPEAP